MFNPLFPEPIRPFDLATITLLLFQMRDTPDPDLDSLSALWSVLSPVAEWAENGDESCRTWLAGHVSLIHTLRDRTQELITSAVSEAPTTHPAAA